MCVCVWREKEGAATEMRERVWGSLKVMFVFTASNIRYQAQ